MPQTENLIQAAVWAAIMLGVAGVAVYIIARFTQTAIQSTARAAGQALAQSEARMRGPAPRPQLVTEGRASMRIPDGAYLIQLVRRIGNEDGAGDEKPLSDLVAALVARGVEPAQVIDARVAATDGNLTLSYLQSGSGDLSTEILRTALSLGFSEPARRTRQPYAPIDAQATLGRRATERAVANVEVLRERLGIDRELEIVSSEMATELSGDIDGLVTMAARVVWRQSDRPSAVRAAG